MLSGETLKKRLFMPIPVSRTPSSLLGEAFRIAIQVHAWQIDLSGDPYPFHVVRVAMQMDTAEEQAVALLHDAVEDAPEDSKYNLLLRIESAYGQNVANAVYALTRIEGEPYPDYIRRVSKDPLAVKVKLADLADNTNPVRLAKLPSYERERLEVKYRIALDILQGERP